MWPEKCDGETQCVLSLDTSVFFATYHRLTMLSTASSHSCCNLIKDLRGIKRKPNQTKLTKQNKTNKVGTLDSRPTQTFVWIKSVTLSVYVCVCEWERQRQRQRALRERSKASGKEIKSFKYQDQSRSKKQKKQNINPLLECKSTKWAMMMLVMMIVWCYFYSSASLLASLID